MWAVFSMARVWPFLFFKWGILITFEDLWKLKKSTSFILKQTSINSWSTVGNWTSLPQAILKNKHQTVTWDKKMCRFHKTMLQKRNSKRLQRLSRKSCKRLNAKKREREMSRTTCVITGSPNSHYGRSEHLVKTLLDQKWSYGESRVELIKIFYRPLIL